ncbi:MAG: hypothetical protein M3R65_01245 [Gemmatimonadota bacterium]|nr:hypothetical protein [Gemmatimonadota bacterium]
MKKTIVALVGALTLTTACKDSLSAPNHDNVVAGTAQPVQNLVTGIIAQDRANIGFSYLLYPETEARNAIRIDPNEPRFINELIGVPIDPSDFIGNSAWTGFYTDIRAANQFIASPSLASLSAGDKAAAIGFVQTMKALSYIRLVQLRDTLGESIQTTQTATPDPLKTKETVLAYISTLLDSANTSLAAGSPSVPFVVPAGFTTFGDYSQTANLIKFNRGLKGEVEVYRGLDHATPCASCFATAITALNIALTGSTSAAASLQMGPYYQYQPAAPESFANPLVDNHIYLTDNFANSIMAGDARAAEIVTAANASSTVSGLKLTKIDPITAPSNLANLLNLVPLIRNAELLLLRAQAEAESGDLVDATADVNVVHTVEGGLSPYPLFASVADARQAILYETRYSMIYQGPYYLILLREYGLLTKSYVTQPGMPSVSSDPTHANDPLQTTLPIPSTESAARNGNTTPTP